MEKRNKKAMGCLTGPVSEKVGGTYMANLFSYMTLSQMIANIRSLLASAGAHNTGMLATLRIYGIDLIFILIFSVAYLIVTIAVVKITAEIQKYRLQKSEIQKADEKIKGSYGRKIRL